MATLSEHRRRVTFTSVRRAGVYRQTPRAAGCRCVGRDAHFYTEECRLESFCIHATTGCLRVLKDPSRFTTSEERKRTERCASFANPGQRLVRNACVNPPFFCFHGTPKTPGVHFGRGQAEEISLNGCLASDFRLSYLHPSALFRRCLSRGPFSHNCGKRSSDYRRN